MPVKLAIKKQPRNATGSSSGSSPLVSVSATPAPSPSHSSPPVTRVRRYLKPAQGRSWDVDSPDTTEGRLSRYNPEDWYAAAKDDQGHSKSILIEFPPYILEELSNHVNSKRFPLGGSNKQAIRVAVLEFLQVLRKLEPQTDTHMALIEAATVLNARAETASQYEITFTSGKQKVHKYCAMGASNEAAKLASDLLVIAKKIPVRELRDKYTTEIKREFKGLLKPKNSVRANVKKNKKRKELRKKARENGEVWES